MKKGFILIFVFCLSVGIFAQNNNRGASTQMSRTTPIRTYTISDTNMLSIAKEVQKVVNDYRVSNGLSALKMQKELNDIAFEHSRRMAKGEIAFSHLDFHDRVNKIDKYANIPYHTAENLYAHAIAPSKLPAAALKGWYNSKGHKKNMDGAFIHTGIGVCRSASGEYFITQVFVGKATFLLAGAGAKGIEELEEQSEDHTTGTISPVPVKE